MTKPARHSIGWGGAGDTRWRRMLWRLWMFLDGPTPCGFCGRWFRMLRSGVATAFYDRSRIGKRNRWCCSHACAEAFVKKVP